MTRDWEAQFTEWAKPPGKTEEDRCCNAEASIRNAIKASDKLKKRNVSVFTQGSYRNNTNVRKDSDVDIGVCCGNVFLNFYPEGTTAETFDFSPADYHYEQFKDEVEEALVNYFGSSAVKRGNKAFDVHETSYHVEADVAVFFTHRHFRKDHRYYEGVALLTDKEKRRIINWPEQHYDNGVDKNMKTGKRFKSIVRILKSLSNEMVARNIMEGDLPGFLLESLVWNVPNTIFQHPDYTGDVIKTIAYIYAQTKTDDLCQEWSEVNGIKILFHYLQKWTREQVNSFAFACWGYAELGG